MARIALTERRIASLQPDPTGRRRLELRDTRCRAWSCASPPSAKFMPAHTLPRQSRDTACHCSRWRRHP